jgi:hypothetical protein
MADAGQAPGTQPGAAATRAGEALADAPADATDVLPWSGVVIGPHPEAVVRLIEFADGREIVPVDLTQVERIDFVGAGAVYNAVKALEERRKAVQIFGATPIVRAILLLIGVAPGHFYKKAH